MKIAYTYHGICTNKIGGVSRYFFEIISKLKNHHDITILGRYSQNIYFKELINKSEFLGDFHFKGKWIIENFLQNYAQKKQLRKTKYDLIHHTGEDPNIFALTGDTPTVLTIHDFIPELFNYQPERIEKRKVSIQKASAIICVSENTKIDLLRFYPDLPKDKIYVIYHGHTGVITDYQENLYGKYILYVGARTKYKNFPFFIKSVTGLLREKNLKVICTGSPFTEEEKTLFSELKISEYVLNSGYASDNKLNNLYHHAVCFVYPSLYEGFGIPILEAFRNECPICLSDTSCFPEIADDCASYFDPGDENSLVGAIRKIADDPNYRSELILKGNQRLDHFSWAQAARQTEEVYRRVLKSN